MQRTPQPDATRGRAVATVVTAMALVIALLGACGSSEDESDLRLSTAELTEAELALSSDAYKLAYDNYEGFYFDVFQACMTDAGFDYFAEFEATSTAPEQTRETVSLYGFNWAATIGVPAFFAPPVQDDQNGEYQQSLDAVASAAYGEQFEACGEAANDEAAVLIPQGPPSVAVQDAISAAERELVESGRLLQSEQAWSECMKSSGFNYDNRTLMLQELYSDQAISNYRFTYEEAVHLARSRGDTVPSIDELFNAAQQREIRETGELELVMAVADWDCQQDAELVDKADAVFQILVESNTPD